MRTTFWPFVQQEFSPDDQVLNGYYYKQEGNDFLHQRLVKNIKATVPAKTVIYFCSEMAARHFCDGGSTTQMHLEMHLITEL